MYLDIYSTIHRGRFLDTELEQRFLAEKEPDYLKKTRQTGLFLFALGFMSITTGCLLYAYTDFLSGLLYSAGWLLSLLLIGFGFGFYKLTKRAVFPTQSAFLVSFVFKLYNAFVFGGLCLYATPETLHLYAMYANIWIFCYYFVLPDTYLNKLISGLIFSLLYFEVNMLVFPSHWAYHLAAFILIAMLNYLGASTILRLEFTAREAFLLNHKLQTEIEEHVRTRFELEYLVMMDPLTEVYNRRYFEQKLGEAHYNAERYQHLFSLVMIDLDYFKRVNDRYGHHVGDDVLKWFTAQAKKSLRESDILARYGGEEFILMLPGTQLAGALIVAERIQRNLKDDPFILEEENLCITASMGISVYQPEMSSAQLLIHADEALYQSKAKGRNQITYTPFEKTPKAVY